MAFVIHLSHLAVFSHLLNLDKTSVHLRELHKAMDVDSI